MSNLRVVGGKVLRPEGIERRRVSHLVISKDGAIQMVSGTMELKRTQMPGMPAMFQGPIHRAWSDVCALFPDAHDLHFVGTLVATPEGEYRGQIDWVKATDAPAAAANSNDQPPTAPSAA